MLEVILKTFFAPKGCHEIYHGGIDKWNLVYSCKAVINVTYCEP